MNLPNATAVKNRPHPMLIVACTAVMLVSLAGTAAIMGWLPNSAGAPNTTDASALPVSAPVAAQQPVRDASTHRVAATPVVHHRPRAEPAPVCQNCGVVASTRAITTGGDGSGLGAAGGAVVGGLLGNQVGGGHGKQAMTVVGAIGGAFAGNQIEKQARATRSYEITVSMDNGASRTVTQASQPEWRDGDHVRIVYGVVRTNT
ncbi:MAG TPA: glycine zipper 2TM domain-containing protein [Pseudoduganella sp.]